MTDDSAKGPKRPKRADVGRGRPPLEHRFKPGQSGNPPGRPRGSGQKINPLDKILNRKIRITEGGKSRSVTIEEAMTMQQVKKAVEGDPKAFAILFKAQAAMEKARREGGPTVEEVLQQREEEAKKKELSAKLSKSMIDWLDSMAYMKKMGLVAQSKDGAFHASALGSLLTRLDPDKVYAGGREAARARPEDEGLRQQIGAYLDKYDPDRPTRRRPYGQP